MAQNWYQTRRRRFLLDFHISDLDPGFLSKFDPDEFAEYVTLAKGHAATIFANTHTGFCNYPTMVGKMHPNLKGRDLLGEMIQALHRRGLNAVIYYCLEYVAWYWETHLEARIVNSRGVAEKLRLNLGGNPRRFAVVCLNNPAYRTYVVDQLTEICTGYDFEGMWPDMTFWPNVCYCPACQDRYWQETGKVIPQKVDWEDPAWVSFQRKRQEWLVDFVNLVTSTIKKQKPGVTVAHQSGTFCSDWLQAPSVELARHMDWLSADLYGERYGMIFWAKLFYTLSEKRPFEHINCWCYPHIHEHLVPRTEDSLRATALAALANDGAMVFIDAVDPMGTIHKKNYLTVRKIFDDLEQYEGETGGELCQDVGVYFSFEANFDLSENGLEPADKGYSASADYYPTPPSAHRNATVNLARTLNQYHIPYGVVTRKDLDRLSDYQVLVLANVVMLADDEMAALRQYVQNGGALWVSKNTSILSIDGVRQENFLLSDLLGVTYQGEVIESTTYVAPIENYAQLFTPFDKDYPLTLYDNPLIVKVEEACQVLATVTLPYTAPTDEKFASMLTNPPGKPTNYPALVLHPYGKGKVLYSSGVIEIWNYDTQTQIVARLIQSLASRSWCVETDAPKAVDITLFHQPERNRYVLNLLNYQCELPNLPVYNIQLKVRMDGRHPCKVRVLPEGDVLEYQSADDQVIFVLPKLVNFCMIAIEYG